MALRLVGSSQFRSFRNLWMLEELGVAYEHVPAKPHSKEAAVNPGFPKKVPTLIDGDLAMFESAAINTYLGDKFRGTPGSSDLVPIPGTPSRGVYEQWVHCAASELDAQGLWIHRKHEALKGVLAPAAPVAVETAKAHVSRVVGVFSDRLKGRDFLVDDGFSAADIVFVHCVTWGESIGWSDAWADDETLQAYLVRCRSRPAYLRAKALP